MSPDCTATAVLILTCRLSPPERVKKAVRRAQDFFPNYDTRFVDGPIGTDPVVVKLFDEGQARRRTKTRASPAEVACYIGHRRAWQALLDSSFDQALVLEDDFKIQNPELMKRVLRQAGPLLAGGRSIVKLFDYPRDRSGNWGIPLHVAGIDLVKWQRPRAGMVAYIISREGAQRLLSRDRVFRVVDEDLKFHWELGLDVWSVLPMNPVDDGSAEVGGSLLEAGRQHARRRSLVRSLKGMALGLQRDIANRRAFARALRRAGLRRAIEIPVRSTSS